MKPKYQRVIIKMSGEALAGNDRFGLNNDVLSAISDQIIQAKETGCEICVVVGGGNFWRGRQGTNMDRTTADYMGMLATTMNALALQDALEQKGH